MSELPNTIWPDHLWVGDKGEVYQRLTYDGDTTGYRRADLPPNLSAALELPEVQALVEALELAANRLHRCAVDYDTGTLRFYETCEWTDEACAALAAIKEPKT